MAKIVIATPTQQMFLQAQEVVSEVQLDAKVLLVTSQSVLEAVEAERKNGALVVVARGNHAHLLKKETAILVVEVVLSGQELALLIAKAKALSEKEYPKIAFVGFRYMFSNPEPLSKILHADVQIYYASPLGDVEEVVHRACADGADVIVGGEIAIALANELGIKTLFLNSTKESMLSALGTARRILYGIEIEKKKAAEFMSLINYSFDAIMKLDPNGQIMLANYMAEKIFRKKESELVGMHIGSLLEISPDSALAQAMQQWKNAYSFVVHTKKEAYIANMASLETDGSHEGFILSLQEFKRIDEMEEQIRTDRYNKGYTAKCNFGQMMTESPLMQDIIEDAQQYAQYDLPVLITGAYGSNKSQIAECIHNYSVRRRNPYVSVDLAALSASMQAAQLLGPSGDGQGKSLIEIAHTGTLLLESIDMLDLQGQYQLLSVIKNGYILRTDGRQMLPVNVRIIGTTCKDLFSLVRQGRFLEPLYAYISRLELAIPSLREHMEDFPQLLAGFMEQFSNKYRKFISLTPEAQALIYAQPWDGDILQLMFFCEKITLLAREKTVDETFVKKHFPRTFHSDEESREIIANLKVPPVVYSKEEAVLLTAMDELGSNRTALAKRLGISKTTLWRRMKKYGLA